MEAKPEVLGKIYPYRKDVPFYVLQFCIIQIFCRCNREGAMNFLKNNVCSLFFLHENRDGHLAGLMEAKPEELGKICTNRKYVTFYAVKFCIHVNFLSVQPLRRYEIFKNNV